MVAFMTTTKKERKKKDLAPRDFGDIGENCHLFKLRELGSTGNYFQGFREQAYNFGDLGSPA